MKTWDSVNRREIETPKKMEDFLNEIESVCRKHDLSISHEDIHGAFIIESFSQHNIDWLRSAYCEIP